MNIVSGVKDFVRESFIGLDFPQGANREWLSRSVQTIRSFGDTRAGSAAILVAVAGVIFCSLKMAFSRFGCPSDSLYNDRRSIKPIILDSVMMGGSFLLASELLSKAADDSPSLPLSYLLSLMAVCSIAHILFKFRVERNNCKLELDLSVVEANGLVPSDGANTMPDLQKKNPEDSGVSPIYKLGPLDDEDELLTGESEDIVRLISSTASHTSDSFMTDLVDDESVTPVEPENSSGDVDVNQLQLTIYYPRIDFFAQIVNSSRGSQPLNSSLMTAPITPLRRRLPGGQMEIWKSPFSPLVKLGGV